MRRSLVGRKQRTDNRGQRTEDKLRGGDVQPIRLKKYHLFWILAIVLSIILTAIMARDITKPFIELHSWGHAHDAWVARSNVKYGLGYTKGFDTFAVGNPPPAHPTRYLDHPILFTLINSAAMYVFGINEWSMRVMNIICTIISLLLFLKILRHLVDDITALLTGLFFCLLPLIAFFGVNMWLYPLVLLAYWCYLAIIGALKDVTVKKWHKPVLALAIFLAIQMTWEGFFFAMALGIHYIFRCIRRKRRPDWILFLILAAAPFVSLALDFVILAAGENWDFKRLFELAKIRSGGGELGGSLTWAIWFGRFIEHALTNFSLPVIIAAIFSLTIGQLYAAIKKNTGHPYSIKFPQFWLFFMPAFFQLTLLRGTLYPHQYWERPMTLFLAIAAAMAIIVIFDIIKKYNFTASIIVSASITILLCAGCIYGINYYYGIRWQNPEDIQMYKYLNSLIPPDKALLSFEPHIIDQFPGVKAASLRPEVAWYLDRDIVPAQELTEIVKKAETGKFPYYLMLLPCERFNNDANTYLSRLNAELAKRYKLVKKYPYLPWVEKKVPWMKKEDFFIRGMLPQAIYDLTQKP
jgi:hypothetical protein